MKPTSPQTTLRVEARAATTFIVDASGPSSSRVTIATDIPARTGMLGVIERALVRRFLKRVYVAELERIREQVALAA
jgi:hypothetical protein